MSDHFSRPRSRPHVDLPLVVDRGLDCPLGEQLTNQLRIALHEGRARAGDRLASSRDLAATLGVSRTVVIESYQQLFAEGWLDGRHGSGTYVAEVAPVPEPPGIASDAREPAAGGARGGGLASGRRSEQRDIARERPRNGRTDAAGEGVNLLPGFPWTAAVHGPAMGRAWRRAWRLAAAVPPVSAPHPRGSPKLRAALVDYLRRSRGVRCGEAQLLVTHGATHGLRLLAETLLRPGDRVGIEEPGYSRARAVLAACGARVVPCPVDQYGLIVGDLPEDLRLIYTTPAHQFPLGGRLPVPRRQALLAWARRHGVLVVEDDYDSEFRYDVAPLPALHGLDSEVVVYLGTTAKTLTPDLRVGWLAGNEDIVDRIADRRDRLADRTPTVPQEAVRVLIEGGDLDRHVRRMRHEYARRRAALVAAFGDLTTRRQPPRLRGDTAGLHVVLELPAGREAQMADAAAQHAVYVDALARHFVGTATVDGLVLGYGRADAVELARGCAVLRRLLDRTAAASGGAVATPRATRMPPGPKTTAGEEPHGGPTRAVPASGPARRGPAR